MTTSKTRAEFEAWARSEAYDITEDSSIADAFSDRDTDHAWEGYQAARRATLEEAAQYLGEMHAKAKSQHNYYAYAANCISALAAEDAQP